MSINNEKNLPLSPAPDGPQHEPEYVVAIGASAGGLEALEELFRAITQRMGVAFVVIQHLLPDVDHHMLELVPRWTSLAVELAQQGQALVSDTIYLLPPDVELSVAQGCLVLVPRPPGQTRPIDVFMRSCAAEYGERSIGVVLSGTGDDGSQGVRDIHAAGGLVIVQREETAKFDGMPRSALETGVVDIAVSPRDIPEVLRRHIGGRKLANESAPASTPSQATGTTTIFALLQAQYGINFAFYKPGTITRRIERRIQLQQHHDLNDYIKRLQSDHAELDALYCDLLIGVTSFFRDAKAFALLENEVIPQLITGATHGPELRVWVAGCATGEEAYSIAMLLLEASERSPHPINVRIFASDVHRPSLDVASAGLYPTASVAEVGEARLARFFVREGDSYRVTNDLRRVLVFAQHNVMSDAPFTKLDFISCRNLLIYVRPAMQRRILSLFHFGLRTNGVLFLGPSETPGEVIDEFETINQQWRVYRKRRDVRLLPAPRESLGPNPVVSATVSRDTYLLELFGSLLDVALPPSVLVDHEYQILHTFGDVRAFLRLPRGRPSLGLLDLLEPSFKLAVAGALHRAARGREPVSFTDVRGGASEEPTKIDIRVRPIEPPGSSALFYLVSLTPTAATAAAAPDVQIDLQQAARDQLEALELDLRQTKESLQATIEELEVSNEELQATNEELLASNEELNSLNQELHSVNEELHSVNSEFQLKIDQLTELSDDMNNLLLSTEIHTLFLDDNLAIRKFTPAIAEVFHLVASDVGRRIDGFAYNLDSPGLVELLGRVRATGQRFEGGVHHKGLSYLMRVLPYHGRGHRAGVVLTLDDVTRLEQVELALREQVEQRDRFLAMLSHELRNPLAAVKNALQLLDRRLDHAQASIMGPVDIISRQTTHMQHLLDDLLDVARLTQGKFQLRKITLDLRALLSEVVDTNRVRLGEHQPSLTLEQRDNEPLWVFGDVTRVMQIFDNLLTNAIKYTPNGGHITVELDSDSEHAIVRVRDDGIGMDAKTQANVFELFVQADASLDRSRGGLGVGLTLVRNLVELHDGRIEVHSDGLGLGSELVVRFPLVPAPAQPAARSDESDEPDVEEKNEPRVIVVEDHPEIRSTLAELLSDCGFEVSIAPDGTSALEMIFAQPPDAALLDIGLPGIDGYELARRLRAARSTASLPLIAMTGYGRPEDLTRALEAGFDTHLVKPVDIDDVLLALARLGVRPSSPAPS